MTKRILSLLLILVLILGIAPSISAETDAAEDITGSTAIS